MVLGIACLGLVTTTVTTFVMQRTEGVHEYSTADLMEAMKADVPARGRISSKAL